MHWLPGDGQDLNIHLLPLISRILWALNWEAYPSIWWLLCVFWLSFSLCPAVKGERPHTQTACSSISVHEVSVFEQQMARACLFSGLIVCLRVWSWWCFGLFPPLQDLEWSTTLILQPMKIPMKPFENLPRRLMCPSSRLRRSLDQVVWKSAEYLKCLLVHLETWHTTGLKWTHGSMVHQVSQDI